jgi:hypothetical protein
MLLATIAMAINLFGNSFINVSLALKSSTTETTIKEVKNHNILDQSRFEEIDFTETEEDRRDDSSGLGDLDFQLSEVYDFFFSGLTFQNSASSSPFLKPLRSKEIPIYLALQNIRL